MPWPEPVGDNTWRVRYRRDDGSKGAIPGFPSETAADDHIATMLLEQRNGSWIDPIAGKTIVGDFAPRWLNSLDIDQRTEENYRSFLKVHILPRWSDTALSDVRNLEVRTWEKGVQASGLAKTTVDSILKCFSLLLTDAADEKLIGANPIQARRRGATSPFGAHSAQGVGSATSGGWLPHPDPAPPPAPTAPELRSHMPAATAAWRTSSTRNTDAPRAACAAEPPTYSPTRPGRSPPR